MLTRRFSFETAIAGFFAVAFMLAAMCGSAGATPYLIGEENTAAGQYLPIGFALDGDNLYSQTISFPPRDGLTQILRTNLRDHTTTVMASLNGGSYWADKMVAGAGRYAFYVLDVGGNSRVTSKLYASDSSAGNLRLVRSENQTLVGNVCGSTVGLGDISKSGSIAYFVYRHKRIKGRCRRGGGRSSIYALGQSENPGLPPSPTLLGSVRNEIWDVKEAGNWLVTGGFHINAIDTSSGKAHQVKTPSSGTYAPEFDVSEAGQVISTGGAKGSFVYSIAGKSTLHASPESHSAEIPLGRSSRYIFCGSNILRYDGGRSSSIDLLANPFIAGGKPPRTILPPTAVNIGFVKCNVDWVAFYTLGKDPEHDKLWAESL